MLTVFVISALLAVAHAQAAGPTAFSLKTSVVVDEKLPATVAKTAKGELVAIEVPELLGNGLTIKMTNYDGAAYTACLKQNVAAPETSSQESWPLYCNVFKFENATKTPVEPAGQATVNVRAGTYYMTIAPAKAGKANVTVELELSGKTCGVGKYNNAGACASYGTIADGTPFMATVASQGVSIVRLDKPLVTITSKTGAGILSAKAYDGAKNVTGFVRARYGAPPTADAFDYQVALEQNKTNTVEMIAPRIAQWYFGVFAGNNSAPIKANVTVSYKQCDKEGQFGADCKTTAAEFGKPGVPVEKELKTGDVLYYKFHRNATAAMASLLRAAAADPASLAVAAASYNADATNQTAPSIYARLGGLASENDFDVVGCSVAKCTDEQNTLIIPNGDVAPALEDDEWYVAVRANADGTVFAWNAAGGACANDCNGAQGECNTETAVCECTADYTSFDCGASTSKLQRWEWALIIGGGVLVAIGLIGCIVFFIQKQQRRSGFERV